MQPPSRIIVLGRSGAGKSTFTRMAAEALGLPAIHLDQLYWQPGWVEGDEAEFVAKVTTIARQESWIIDGGYSVTWPHTMPRAHAIVYLDQPRWQCLLGAIRRIISTYGKVRPDSAPGCPERFDLEFLNYIWTWGKQIKPIVEHAIETRPSDCALHIIRQRDEIQSTINALQSIDPQASAR